MLIVDDPVKNAEDANSETMRERTWDWWLSTAYTRLEPDGSALVIQTRWHEDDLTGRLIAEMEAGGEQWVVLNLPALAEAEDVIGRKVGDALWPKRFPMERLKQIEQTIGPYWWHALYQQRPTPLEGAILQRSWMQRRYVTPPAMERIIQTVDTATKIGQENDYSVIATWGTDGVSYYLMNVSRGKWDFPMLKRMITQQFHYWEPSGVYIEDASSGQALLQELARETMIPAIEVKPVGRKESRVHAVSGLFAAGKVKLPATAPWLADWVAEHLRFPNATHDDQVDTTAMALSELAYKSVPVMEWV
jgi:predicted phage terminase large subunit-like protein